MRHASARAAALVLLATPTAWAADPFDLAEPPPTLEAPPPGTTIDAGNVERYRALLPDQLPELIAAGWLAITVGRRLSFPPAPAYVEATRAHAGEAKLPGPDGGPLAGYVAGLPFPDAPQEGDPDAGHKLAWNVRFAFDGDAGEVQRFYWQYRNARAGSVERELSFYGATLRFRHRHVQPPVPDLEPNPANIYRSLYLQVHAPPDIRNTQLLVETLEDDADRQRVWLYVSNQRRVRRLASGQTTDSFLGSDIMIEDFLGYNGRIMDMTWSFAGTRWVLLPMFRHDRVPTAERPPDPDHYGFVGFHGRGECFPNVTWQLRKAYVLEARPRWAQHPLSLRRYFVDAQTFTLPVANLYDRGEKLWKVAIAALAHPDSHRPENRGTYVPIIDAATMLDVQAEHCTTLQFKALVQPKGLRPSLFSVQALRKRGR